MAGAVGFVRRAQLSIVGADVSGMWMDGECEQVHDVDKLGQRARRFDQPCLALRSLHRLMVRMNCTGDGCVKNLWIILSVDK